MEAKKWRAKAEEEKRQNEEQNEEMNSLFADNQLKLEQLKDKHRDLQLN